MVELSLKDAWEAVDREYIGVRLNTGKVKPAHIANGLFRSILGKTSSTKRLNEFVCIPQPKTGMQCEEETEKILTELRHDGRANSRIDSKAIQSLRRVVRSVVTADNTVFPGGMDSYSAGHVGFVSRDRIGQEAGEFAGAWLRAIKSPLTKSVKDALNDAKDIVTMLCAPLFLDESLTTEPPELPTGLLNATKATQRMWKGLSEAADTLSQHVAAHPDKLFRLRQGAMFCGVVALRHIASLEAHYVEKKAERVMPFVLDCSPYSAHDIRDASKRSLARTSQSLVRFYGWAFAEHLKKHYTAKELQKMPAPSYHGRTSETAKELWQQARAEADKSSQKFVCFGEALYDILAVEAGTTNPVSYLRSLGRHIGLIHPPSGATAWFAPKQDITQLLLYCCVKPGECISMQELLTRLWDRFGVIIGGRSEDEHILMAEGITLWDRDLLRLNTKRYSESILQMDCGTYLADGVLSIHLGGQK